MNEIKPIVIPADHVAFARCLAELASLHGIDSFDMTFRAKFDIATMHETDRRLHGDIKIHYHDRDGRGRPSKNLSIFLDTRSELPIIKNPSSYS